VASFQLLKVARTTTTVVSVPLPKTFRDGSFRFISMRSSLLLGAALPLVHGIRIIQSNDDGWAEIQARTFFNSLSAAGHQVVLSGPAENQSGTGTLPYRFRMRLDHTN